MLQACIDVDRENLVRGKNALVVIKPNLIVCDHYRASVKVRREGREEGESEGERHHIYFVQQKFLEETSLQVETLDSDGVVTTKEIQPFPLYDDKYDFFFSLSLFIYHI
jgi:hypothetical protein